MLDAESDVTYTQKVAFVFFNLVSYILIKQQFT